MCFYHDDYAVISDSRAVRARKPHRCAACRGAIARGEEYERHSGLADGGFYSEALCRRCCYDTFRVVEHELAEGCSWQEAWPAASELVDYLHESELGQTRPEDVPAGFKIGDMPSMPNATAGGPAGKDIKP